MGTNADVLVVGAGPAGAAAATALARAGRSVVVVDRARFPRDKCCGDGLTTLALRELEALGFDPTTVPSWRDVDGAWIRSPSGREVHAPLPRDRGRYAAVATRSELDAALVDLARAAGATVLEGHTFTGLAPASPGSVVAHVRGLGDITVRYVFAADGVWSPVRKALGLAEPGYLGEWHAMRQYVSGTASDRLHVWFDADLLPGYAWSFPLADGRANVGLCVLRSERSGKRHQQLWCELTRAPHVLEALGPDATWEGRATAWPIPAAVDRAVTGSGRTLFLGDAVRAPDLLTGEGIGQALLTARLAAHAVLRAGATRPDQARDTYRRSVRHELVADHRMSAALARVLSHPWGARGAVRVIGTSGAWGRQRFARWMFEDEPRAIVLTPSRWHRHFLDRPGAYPVGYGARP